ncbi:YjbF family lipoprotein [Maribius pontilimi]|uniref:YjbF family lipoprotein n=1 Tax=Palleronia pontilimi TaxID=1964209 RepID=A0A934I975_9RHOB|nr:YjbF family lipoprotein [Palleronia pontilimi]MBJ3762713.1 YjbF family lipoprotein [Palleronia pontilimi]
MTARLPILALIALTAIAGCSNRDSSDERGLTREVVGALSSVFRRGDDASTRITLTDAQLNASPADLMLMKVPELGSEAGLVTHAQNRDVTTWITPDGTAVSLKDGQVVSTAGFGSDIASAQVPDLRGGAERVVRDHYRLLGDEDIHLIRYFCALRRSGDTVSVTGRSFATTRIDEECRTEDGQTAQNVYWIDGRGVVRQSRQFVSPQLGYIELQAVHTGLR